MLDGKSLYEVGSTDEARSCLQLLLERLRTSALEHTPRFTSTVLTGKYLLRNPILAFLIASGHDHQAEPASRENDGQRMFAVS